jgi:micrococcal nuclease
MRCAIRLLFVSFFLATGTSCGSTPQAADPAGQGTVDHVVDGDTIVVNIEGHSEHVRLIGIDTPETVKPNAPVGCHGPEASAAAKQLLPPGTIVRLERDTEARDAYNRLLAYVYRVSDGLFINLELAIQGHAIPLAIRPNVAYENDFRLAVDAARAAQRGLWGHCPDPTPTKQRKPRKSR